LIADGVPIAPRLELLQHLFLIASVVAVQLAAIEQRLQGRIV
jgi:hypothetical protein